MFRRSGKSLAGQFGFSGDGDDVFTPAERETLAAVVEGVQKGGEISQKLCPKEMVNSREGANKSSKGDRKRRLVNEFLLERMGVGF